jgi:hypothetical protein
MGSQTTIEHPPSVETDESSPASPLRDSNAEAVRQGEPKPNNRRSRRRAFGLLLLFVIALLCIVRAVLPGIIRDYVNRTIDNPRSTTERSARSSCTYGEGRIRFTISVW